MFLVINRFLIKGHFNFSPNKCYHQNLLSLLNKMIYIIIYIYIFFYCLWLVCKIRNTKLIFLAQKVLVGLRVNTHT